MAGERPVFVGTSPQRTTRRPDPAADQAEMLRRLRRRLHRAQHANSPGALTDPLTPRTARRETRAATRAKFGPAQHQLHLEHRRSHAQHANIDDWYGQYLAQVEQSRLATEAGYQQAQDGLRAGQAQARQATALEQQQFADDGSAVARAGQAGANRAMLTDSFVAQLAGQGASQNTLLAGKATIGAGDRTAAHLRERQVGRDVDRDLRALAAQKGDFRVEYRGQLRDAERRWLLERKGFGLDRQKAAADAADDVEDNVRDARDKAADNRRDRRKANNAITTWGYTNAEWARLSPGAREAIIQRQASYGKSGGSGGSAKDGKDRFGNTRIQRRAARNDLDAALQAQRDAIKTTGKPLDLGALMDFARVEPDIARAAVYWAGHGEKFSPKIAKYLRRLGVHVAPRRVAGPGYSPGSDASQRG